MNENTHAYSFLHTPPLSPLSSTPASSNNLLLHTGFVWGRRLHVAGSYIKHNTSVALQTFVYTSTARWRPSNRRCLNLDVQRHWTHCEADYHQTNCDFLRVQFTSPINSPCPSLTSLSSKSKTPSKKPQQTLLPVWLCEWVCWVNKPTMKHSAGKNRMRQCGMCIDFKAVATAAHVTNINHVNQDDNGRHTLKQALTTMWPHQSQRHRERQ